MTNGFYQSATRTEQWIHEGALAEGFDVSHVRRVPVPVTERCGCETKFPSGPAWDHVRRSCSCDNGTRPALWALILPGDHVWWGDDHLRVIAVHDDGSIDLYAETDQPNRPAGWHTTRIYGGHYSADLTLDIDRIGENPVRQTRPELMPDT